MNIRYITGIMLFLSLSVVGQKSMHNLWTAALQEHVDDDGNVNYKSWKKDTTYLDNYLQTLEENPPVEAWSKSDSLAYFINAYNAVTVKLILDKYPLKSIWNLVTPWRFKRFTLNGEKVSLNHIEHEILRKMNEPRIHFAINCASASCPKLINVAFESHTMEKQLEQVTRDFINDPKRNKLSEKKIEISRIFQWFSDDFGNKKERIAFIRKYANQPFNENPKVDFLTYDWQLNE
ncbi:DUF547 domain-containing protein [Flavobacteriaceae bacterium]|nr:DUF547 domain-containing protein [Flavobacteriaceae bacterium]